jgi:predicted anti-sigma-YlaC factor YlaD
MTGRLSECNEIRHALGVYVVGAIDPAERSIVDAHLTQCLDCREELAGLAGLPALLGRVPLEDAERLALGDEELEEAPAELLDALLAQVSARRRARRWRGIAVAAAAAIIAVGGGGIAGGILMSHQHAAPTQAAGQGNSYLIHGSNPATHVTAAIYYSSAKSGTKMQVAVTGIPNGTHCMFWATTTAGQHLLIGGWTVNGYKSSGNWYTASTTVPTSQLRSFDISGAHGKVLVSVTARLPGSDRYDGTGNAGDGSRA